MSNEFRWSVEDFLGKPPLDMILEGLGALCATPLEVRDTAGGSAALGPAPEGDLDTVLSPIQVQGREAGMVVGYSSGEADRQVPMTVALAASVISQFLRSTREVENLSVEVERCSRGLTLLERAGSGDEQEVARWFLDETLELVDASTGVLFSTAGGRTVPLAWSGSGQAPRAAGLTGLVATRGEPVVVRSLGRLPDEVTLHQDPGSCPLESFFTTPAMAVPVGFGDRCLGVLWACGHRQGGLFDRSDLDLLCAMASQIGLYLWGGRAVGLLQSEETARQRASAEKRIRSAYLPTPDTDGPLRILACPEGASGSLRLADGRAAVWATRCLGEGEDYAIAAAAVVRATLEAHAPCGDGPAGLVAAVAGTLDRFESEGAPAHRLFVACLADDGRLEAAWRRLSGTPVLEGQESAGEITATEIPGTPGAGYEAVVDLGDGEALTDPDNTFRLTRCREGRV